MDGSLAAAREPLTFPSIHSLSIKISSFCPYRFSSISLQSLPLITFEVVMKSYRMVRILDSYKTNSSKQTHQLPYGNLSITLVAEILLFWIHYIAILNNKTLSLYRGIFKALNIYKTLNKRFK